MPGSLNQKDRDARPASFDLQSKPPDESPRVAGRLTVWPATRHPIRRVGLALIAIESNQKSSIPSDMSSSFDIAWVWI